MADRTPLFKGGRLNTAFRPLSQSPNHSSLLGRGQNVLFLDGRSVWHERPVVGVNSDNIWQAGKLKLDGLITHEFSLDDINEALEIFGSGEAGRVLLTM